jgi:hypothetical protein
MRLMRTLISVAGTLILAAGADTATAADTTGRPVLRLDPPQQFHFVALTGDHGPADRYDTALTTRGTAATAHDVKAVYDLSALAGKVTLDALDERCVRAGWTVTCAVGDVRDTTRLFPFTLLPVEGVPAGEAGRVEERYTGSDADPLHHTRRVHLGRPEPRYGTHAPYTVPDAERGSLPPLTPVFANTGQVEAPAGVLLVVHTDDGDFAGERYSNCLYSTVSWSRGWAYCRFEDPLAPGTAFETDGAFRAVTDPCCRVKGTWSYQVLPLGDVPFRWEDDGRGEYGDGRTLGLKPVGTGAAPNTRGLQEYVSAGRWHTDWQQPGITLTGRTGEITAVKVPSPRNLGPDDPAQLVPPSDPSSYERELRVRVTLPEGVSLYPLQPHEQAEPQYCDYEKDGRTVSCTIGDWSYLRVRLDRKVEGAEGTATVAFPGELTDPDLSNNTAPVTVDITGTTTPPAGPTPSAGTRPTPAPSSGAPSGTPAAPAPPAPAAQPPATGSMADTGTSAPLPLLATAAATATAAGLALLLTHRRRASRRP